MSQRLNGLNLSVKRVLPVSAIWRSPQPPKYPDKSRTREAGRAKVAKLLAIGRKLTSKSSKPWELVARTAEGVCGRIDQHKGIIIRRHLLTQAARHGWDYTQAACRWGCSCIDVVESIAKHLDLGIAGDNTIFVIPPDMDESGADAT